jgi:crossover junction endodeoxyribonuclease RusA
MTIQRFTVTGNPIPKARPRVVHGHTYTPAETTRAEQRVQMHARKARVRCTDQPVFLWLAFYRENALSCDLDNLIKLVQDALNGLAWKDDRQIVQVSALKAIDREHPRTEVEIGLAADALELRTLRPRDDERDPLPATARKLETEPA